MIMWKKKKKNCVAQQRERVIKKEGIYNVFCQTTTGKNNGFPFLDILGYLKIPIKTPNLAKWDKSQPGNSQPSSLNGTFLTLPNLGFLWVFFKYAEISKNGNVLFFPVNPPPAPRYFHCF